MRHLVLHDTDHIKEYVFATGRLREIRGASVLLRRINQGLGAEAPGAGGTTIVADGGTLVVSFDDAGQAREFCCKVAREYERETSLASSTGVVVPYDVGDFGAGYKRAQGQLRLKKRHPRPPSQTLGHRHLALCSFCRQAPGMPLDAQERKGPDVAERAASELGICAACRAKRKEGRRRRWGDIERGFLAEVRARLEPQADAEADDPPERTFAKDFHGIGECSKGYIALVNCDGNRMGQRFGEAAQGGSAALTALSEAVNEKVRETAAGVLAEVLGSEGRPYPFQVALHGGDDLVLVLPAKYALPFAIRFTREVSGALGAACGGQFSFSAGVAIAQDSHPVARLRQLSEALLRSAKKLSHRAMRSNGQETSCVDFQVVTSAGSDDDLERERIGVGERRLTGRPYTADRLEQLMGVTAMAKDAGIPRGHLQEALEVLWGGNLAHSQLHWTWMKQRAGKPGKDERRKALDDFEDGFCVDAPGPWFAEGQHRAGLATALPDLIELYDLVGQEGG